MTTKTLGAWGAGCGTQVLIRLGVAVVFIVVLFGCLIVISLVPLPAGLDRELLAALAIVLVTAGLAVAAIAGGVGLIVWRGRQLDAAFAPLGLKGGLLSLNGRQYHGPVNGRRLDAYFSRGPALDLYLSTPLQTRLAVTRRDVVGQALAGLVNRTPLVLDDLQLAPLAIYPQDPDWTLKLLQDARVRDLLLRLTDASVPGAGRFETRHITLQPDGLLFRLYHVHTAGITAEAVRGWLSEMGDLLRLWEAAPPPKLTSSATRLETTVRTNRTGMLTGTLVVLFVAIGVLIACAAIFGVISALVGAGQ